MTAEIAIMNRSGLALAADSAVTVSFPDRRNKVFTANKLFMLSKYYPVGAMIYGSASICGIPWELIIKEFRKRHLGNTSFGRLEEYATNFISHLSGNSIYFTDTLQCEAVSFALNNQIGIVMQDFNVGVGELFADDNIKSDEEFNRAKLELFEGHLQTRISELEDERAIDGFEIDEASFYRQYEAPVNNTITFLNNNLPDGFGLSDTAADQIRRIAYLAVIKDLFRYDFNTTGIVIAGYGEDQIYPSLVAYAVEGVFDGKLKFVKTHDDSDSQNAVIVPFAQSEMIATFIDGVSPDYRDSIDGYVKQVFNAKLPDIGDTLFEEFQAHSDLAARRYGSDPILNAVGSLPVEQLASMAHTLVNLTAFKRQVTPELETVGGPVDVAVITKGDGFIWIERKHYFDASKNPHFATNYYRGDTQNADAKRHHN